MAVRHVFFHPIAMREAEDASDWYEERSSQSADGFQHELRHAIERIAEHPGSHPRIEGEIRRIAMRRYPYFVIYEEDSVGIQILAVAHAKRKPGYWQSRVN